MPETLLYLVFIAFLVLAAIKSIDFQSLSQQSPCLLSITAKFEESDDFFKRWKRPQPTTLNDNFCLHPQLLHFLPALDIKSKKGTYI